MRSWLLGPADVRRLLPQQPPFLFVDFIESYVPGERLVARKAVTVGENHFVGHFPDLPIMPGVLVVEALAQAACALALLDALKWEPGAPLPTNALSADTTAVLGSIRMIFHAPVFPGSLLTLKADLSERRAAGFFFDLVAEVDGELVVKGTATVAMVSRSSLER